MKFINTDNLLADDSRRRELGSIVRQMIDAGINEYAGLKKRWDIAEALYRGDPDAQAKSLYDGHVPRTYNIVKPMVRAIVRKVCNPLTTQDPMFTPMDGDLDSPVAAGVQSCFIQAGYPKKVRSATRIACMASPAIFKAPFSVSEGEDDGDYKQVGPTLTVLHPANFALYPRSATTVEAAVYVGDRWFATIGDLDEMRERGELWSGSEFNGSDDIDQYEAGVSNEQSKRTGPQYARKEDEPVELWDGILRADLDEDGYCERYFVRLAYATSEIVTLTPYATKMSDGTMIPYSRPWYFPHYIEDSDETEFYASMPIVADLQADQGAFNDIKELLIEGSRMAAFPKHYQIGGSQQSGNRRYGPGQVEQVDAGVEFKTLPSEFNVGALTLMLGEVRNDAEALTNVTRASSGQQYQSSTTATAVSAYVSGQEEGADEYRDVAATSGEALADWYRELIYIHYSQMSEAYPDTFPQGQRQEYRKPRSWEATGKTPSSNPAVQSQNVATFLGQVAQLNPQSLGIDVRALVKGLYRLMRAPVPEKEVFPDDGQVPGGDAVTGMPGAGGAPPADALALPAGGGGPSVPDGGMPNQGF